MRLLRLNIQAKQVQATIDHRTRQMMPLVLVAALLASEVASDGLHSFRTDSIGERNFVRFWFS